jgi:simple sugar transport system permease protein
VGILLAGLLLALTYVGGSAAETAMNIPSATIQIFQGMLLFVLLSVDVLTNYRLRWAAKSGGV